MSNKSNKSALITFCAVILVVIGGLKIVKKQFQLDNCGCPHNHAESHNHKHHHDGENHKNHKRTIKTLYGNFHVKEQVLLDLMDCPVMQRLKKIHQYGPEYQANGCIKDYSRYDHCVGVWALLRRYGASLEEQIAGLLHDASHTVFSHVGDVLFNYDPNEDAYQDDIHEWYLQQGEVPAILTKHGLNLDQVLHKSGDHVGLEQHYPDICADRLEYNLHGGLLENLLTHDDIKEILDDLSFENSKWVFKTPSIAAKFSSISLFHTENIWGSPDGYIIYDLTAKALRQAMIIKLLDKDDIHFSTDDVVWEKLASSDDPLIKACIDTIKKHKKMYKLNKNHDTADHIVRNKFRGIDPLIKYNGELKRLTELHDDYAFEYNRVKELVGKGWPISFIGSELDKKLLMQPLSA